MRIDVNEFEDSLVALDSIITKVYSARGEMEIGLPITRGTLHIRPYGLPGCRWDGGDVGVTLSAEYGGGISARHRNFFIEASARPRSDSDNEDVDLKAYSLSLGGNRGNDDRGFILRFRQNSGPSQYDPFGGVPGAAAGRPPEPGGDAAL